jgi:hypothetical protein
LEFQKEYRDSRTKGMGIQRGPTETTDWSCRTREEYKKSFIEEKSVRMQSFIRKESSAVEC